LIFELGDTATENFHRFVGSVDNGNRVSISLGYHSMVNLFDYATKLAEQKIAWNGVNAWNYA
jgi:hypothetical protein